MLFGVKKTSGLLYIPFSLLVVANIGKLSKSYILESAFFFNIRTHDHSNGCTTYLPVEGEGEVLSPEDPHRAEEEEEEEGEGEEPHPLEEPAEVGEGEEGGPERPGPEEAVGWSGLPELPAPEKRSSPSAPQLQRQGTLCLQLTWVSYLEVQWNPSIVDTLGT